MNPQSLMQQCRARGATQAQIAEAIGIVQSQVSKVLSGKHADISWHTWERLKVAARRRKW